MSVEMDSNIDEYTIYVKIVDESVDTWRPVRARKLADTVFTLLDQEIPEEEIWEFLPNQTVSGQFKSEGGERIFFAEKKVE